MPQKLVFGILSQRNNHQNLFINKEVKPNIHNTKSN